MKCSFCAEEREATGNADYVCSDCRAMTGDDVARVRTIAEIKADVLAHDAANPRHGKDCSCMDKYVREVRQQLDVGTSLVSAEHRWAGVVYMGAKRR